MGRVNIGAALDPAAERVLPGQSVLLEALAQRHEVTFVAADPSQPVRATLVWTDAPGLPEEEFALVNDLELSLVTPSGMAPARNNFVDGVSVPGGQADPINNVENIYLTTGEDGVYSLTVTAANLPG